LTKGTRVTVEGVWSKRTRTTKDGQPRINDVLTVTKIRLFTETEISRPNVVEDGDEPALSRETHHRWHQRRLLGIVVRPPQVVRRCDIKPATGLSRCIAFPIVR
jgi:hypothetical protein